MNKLKNCPLCGGEAELFKQGGLFRTTKFDTYYVECNDCGVQMGVRENLTSQDVIKKWNRRYAGSGGKEVEE